MAKKYYVYFLDNKNNGITDTWDKCKNIVSGTNARYKSFKTLSEAETWLKSGANYEYGKKEREKERKEKEFLNYKLEDAVYFDSGTGRGEGVEVRITDENKKSLIETLLDEKFKNFLNKKSWIINEFNNILLDKKRTNNYGELLGLYLALEYAERNSKNKIYGDSKLVFKKLKLRKKQFYS